MAGNLLMSISQDEVEWARFQLGGWENERRSLLQF